MLFPVSQLLQNKEAVLTIQRDTKVRDALSLMVENDFSQLPIVDEKGKLVGIATEKSIIGTYFHTTGMVSILDLNVGHCQTKPYTIQKDADIFEVLDLLKNTYAIVVVDHDRPIGILTDYDTTHFFRDLSEGLILVEDIEVTLRHYIEATHPNEHSLDTALMRAFRAHRQDPTRPAKEYTDLSFGDHIQLITAEDNWERFSAYFEPKEMFLQLMNQVGQIRNQLAHFRGRIEPIQYNALLRARDWLSSRSKPIGARAKEIHRSDIHVPLAKDNEGKYDALQKWLQEQKEAGVTSLRIGFEEIEEILQDSLPPSARTHRSWWANEYSSHVQAMAWLRSGWLVDDADLEKGEIIFRQSVSALYPQFFTTMLNQLKETRPGLTQASRVSTQNWLALSGGRTGFSFIWSLPKEGVGGGALRVELWIDVGDKVRNKDLFESLKSREKEIESQISIQLNWERLEARKGSRISALIPFKLAAATPEEILEAQSWGVATMLKFIDVFTPYVKGL
jgi:CBS domain-containing protein